MKWNQQAERAEFLSDVPVTPQEMTEFTGDDADDRKCNIVFPR